jgi:TP901-1 family phage major tail protein
MACSTTIVNTSVLNLYFDSDGLGTWVKVAHSTDASISFSAETVDITTKDTSGYRDTLAGLKSWSANLTAFIDYAATFGQEELVDKWIAGECVKVRFTTNVASDVYYEGDATITSVELNSSGAEEAASFSLTLENAGAITKGTIA